MGFIQSSLDGQLGQHQWWTVVTNAAMAVGVHISVGFSGVRLGVAWLDHVTTPR